MAVARTAVGEGAGVGGMRRGARSATLWRRTAMAALGRRRGGGRRSNITAQREDGFVQKFSLPRWIVNLSVAVV
uniref:Uncharacterized protein n=1 Tax=Oryza sativa subsp. japonica TaxID=39947 RepID=Q2R074_ORYSJ|nr:hypothetical protein LOC_Os11g43540 [Oryza sativa Japonica Group]